MESSSTCSASANDCSADVSPSLAVGAPGSLRATVTNNLPVFESCRKCSGSSIGGTIPGLGQVERSCLNIVTRVIVLHEQKKKDGEWRFDRYRKADFRSGDQ